MVLKSWSSKVVLVFWFSENCQNPSFWWLVVLKLGSPFCQTCAQHFFILFIYVDCIMIGSWTPKRRGVWICNNGFEIFKNLEPFQNIWKSPASKKFLNFYWLYEFLDRTFYEWFSTFPRATDLSFSFLIDFSTIVF